MTLREQTAIVSTILVIVGTVWYIFLALTGRKVRLVLAAWLVNSVATTLSFATYWTAPRHNLVSNAYNATSVLTITSIFVTALIIARREKKGFNFSPFQKKCLVASGLITILWIVLVFGFKGTGVIPNILMQVMMLVGYFVIAERLWRATVNTESLFVWWCIVLASLAGMITAMMSSDWLASVFAGRTLFGSFVLVLLMHRLEWKAKSLKA